MLTLYGLGNILGAGIYVLVGKVAGSAGYAAPVSFWLACFVAAFTAFSYMELSSRYPRAAGVSVYLHRALGIKLLSVMVGLLLVGAGIVSAATLANGFVGYFSQFVAAPAWLVKAGVVAVLAGVALAGISHSARLAAGLAIIEVAGLVLVVIAGAPYLNEASSVLQNVGAGDLWHPGVLVGAVLAFYAFIGFEDMIDVVEEVKKPRITMPRAILWALLVSTGLYTAVVVVALSVVGPGQLAESPAPLAMVFNQATGYSGKILAAIGLMAIVNGILVQIVMGSRVLYGLARQGWIHASLGVVDGRVRTPVLATVIVATAMVGMAVSFPIVKLAGLTSLLTLTVFLLVNASLLVIKGRSETSEGHYKVSYLVPLGGCLATAGMILAAVVA
jgi:basic amino acid/polyamine antiporter, APA family